MKYICLSASIETVQQYETPLDKLYASLCCSSSPYDCLYRSSAVVVGVEGFLQSGAIFNPSQLVVDPLLLAKQSQHQRKKETMQKNPIKVH